MADDDHGPFAEFDAGFRLLAAASTNDLMQPLTVSATSTGRPVATTYRFTTERTRSWVEEVVAVDGDEVALRGSSPGVRTLGPPPNFELVQPVPGATVEVRLSFGAGVDVETHVVGAPPPGAASVALYEWVGSDTDS